MDAPKQPKAFEVQSSEVTGSKIMRQTAAALIGRLRFHVISEVPGQGQIKLS